MGQNLGCFIHWVIWSATQPRLFLNSPHCTWISTNTVKFPQFFQTYQEHMRGHLFSFDATLNNFIFILVQLYTLQIFVNISIFLLIKVPNFPFEKGKRRMPQDHILASAHHCLKATLVIIYKNYFTFNYAVLPLCYSRLHSLCQHEINYNSLQRSM
jgi:hypothetical protein